MRYLILVAMSVISAALTGGVFTQVTIVNANPDIVMCAMIAMVLAEGGVTPVIYFTVASVSLDVLIGSAIGMYSLPCILVGLTVYFIAARSSRPHYIAAAIAGAAGWAARELLLSLFTVFMGYTYNFGHIILTSLLPGLPVAAAITFAIYCGMVPLYKKPFMRPLQAPGAPDVF